MNEVTVPRSPSLRVSRTCIECGRGFAPKTWHQKTCGPECRRERGRRITREYMAARYWADPEASRATSRAFYHQNPQRAKDANKRYRSVTCTRCGAAHDRGLRLDERADYICGTCKSNSQLQIYRCWYCDEPFQELPYNVQNPAKVSCEFCYGFFERTAKAIGITRERVRQLVNKRRSFYRLETRVIAGKAVENGWRPSMERGAA